MRNSVAAKRRTFLPGRVLFLALALVFSSAGNAAAATIIVDWTGAGDYLTVQEGLEAAVNGDTVRVRSGTYTLPVGTHLDFDGKAVRLTSVSGPESTIIEGPEPYDFCVRFESGEAPFTRLNGFTLDGILVRIHGQCITDHFETTFFCGRALNAGAGPR